MRSHLGSLFYFLFSSIFITSRLLFFFHNGANPLAFYLHFIATFMFAHNYKMIKFLNECGWDKCVKLNNFNSFLHFYSDWWESLFTFVAIVRHSNGIYSIFLNGKTLFASFTKSMRLRDDRCNLMWCSFVAVFQL